MDTFQALGDPTRRNILELLVNSGHMSASDIYKRFTVTPPSISQHLKILKEAKLVDVEKRAQQRIYTVNTRSIQELERWIHKMTKQWDERFDRLEKLLKKEVKRHGKK